MSKQGEELQAILDISIALSSEKNRNKLFDLIINKSMELTRCDAATLYICKEDGLHFKIMKTLSQGVDKGSDGSVIDIPPAPMNEEHICAYCAIHQVSLNIPDVYDENDQFDFNGPKKYDAMIGYHTQSMLAIPLVNDESRTIGVMQLINATNDKGEVVAFNERQERIILALASQAAIAATNAAYQEEIKELMWSFTEAMAEAIDARTPYNASHTRNVAKYSGMIADYINKLHAQGKEEEYFSEQRREQLVMGAYLHDIGKLVTPLEVMNKATRLEGHEQEIRDRLDNFALKYKIQRLNGTITDEEYARAIEQLGRVRDIVTEVNGAGFIDEGLKSRLDEIIDSYIEYEGEKEPFFTDEEKHCLTVVRGTLTDEERQIMQDHVKMTERILSKVHFNSYFKDSPVWAAQHHECLNGKGYPRGLKAEDLKLESRILAVADICDALLATDRPYKKPIPKDKAFDIMRDMAKAGNIEGYLVEYLYQCIE